MGSKLEPTREWHVWSQWKPYQHSATCLLHFYPTAHQTNPLVIDANIYPIQPRQSSSYQRLIPPRRILQSRCAHIKKRLGNHTLTLDVDHQKWRPMAKVNWQGTFGYRNRQREDQTTLHCCWYGSIWNISRSQSQLNQPLTRDGTRMPSIACKDTAINKLIRNKRCVTFRAIQTSISQGSQASHLMQVVISRLALLEALVGSEKLACCPFYNKEGHLYQGDGYRICCQNQSYQRQCRSLTQATISFGFFFFILSFCVSHCTSYGSNFIVKQAGILIKMWEYSMLGTYEVRRIKQYHKQLAVMAGTYRLQVSYDRKWP